jgi:hypothetical protein
MNPHAKVFTVMEHFINKGYTITPEGQIISRHKKPLKYHIAPNGYYSLNMGDSRKLGGTVYPHKWQAYVKYGREAYLAAECVRHLDGNRLNNHRDNIAIGTHKENHQEIPKHILQERARKASPFAAKARRKANAKRMKAKWAPVWADIDAGMRHKEVSEKYNIPLSTIRNRNSRRKRGLLEY